MCLSILGSHYELQAALKLMILLLQPPMCHLPSLLHFKIPIFLWPAFHITYIPLSLVRVIQTREPEYPPWWIVTGKNLTAKISARQKRKTKVSFQPPEIWQKGGSGRWNNDPQRCPRPNPRTCACSRRFHSKGERRLHLALRWPVSWLSITEISLGYPGGPQTITVGKREIQRPGSAR
jgi:hypothetical protein